jgi:hypothetical protein
VWVYLTGGSAISDVTINYSPSNAFEQIYSNGYQNPTRWAFEVKAPLIKDFLADILVTIVIVGICTGSQFLPPPIDVAGLEACAQYVASQNLLDLAGYLNDLPQLIQFIAPIVTLDSVTITYQDGSTANIPSSEIQFEGGSSTFPTFLDTLNSIASKKPGANVVAVHSPVNLLIVDSQGRKTGIDSNGQVYNDIPGSINIVPGQTALLPLSLTDYNVQLTGTGTGTYKLNVAYVAGSLDVSSASGTVSSGEGVNYSVQNSSGSITIAESNSTNWVTVGLAAAITAVIVVVSSEVILRRKRLKSGMSYGKWWKQSGLSKPRSIKTTAGSNLSSSAQISPTWYQQGRQEDKKEPWWRSNKKKES